MREKSQASKGQTITGHLFGERLRGEIELREIEPRKLQVVCEHRLDICEMRAIHHYEGVMLQANL